MGIRALHSIERARKSKKEQCFLPFNTVHVLLIAPLKCLQNEARSRTPVWPMKLRHRVSLLSRVLSSEYQTRKRNIPSTSTYTKYSSREVSKYTITLNSWHELHWMYQLARPTIRTYCSSGNNHALTQTEVPDAQTTSCPRSLFNSLRGAFLPKPMYSNPKVRFNRERCLSRKNQHLRHSTYYNTSLWDAYQAKSI